MAKPTEIRRPRTDDRPLWDVLLGLWGYPAVLVECGFLSNRYEGGEARDSEYREALADRIAEAIVEHRYGSGVYHSSRAAIAQPPGESTVLAPSKLRRD